MKTILLSRKNFIKIILTSLFFVSLPAFALAATTTEPLSQTAALATVSIYNATSTQKGNTFTISFDLANRIGVQPGVRYGISLVQKIDNRQIVADEQVYSEVLNLGENSTFHKTVTYEAPDRLSGDYYLILSSKNSSGFPFGVVSLGKVSLQSTSPSPITVDASSCYLTIAGDKKETHYTPTQGVDLSPTETLQANCMVENTTTSSITFTPSFITHERTAYGEVVTTEGVNVVAITVGAKKKQLVTITVPKATQSQSYETTLVLEKSHVNFRYSIWGTSATIQSVVVDRSIYQKGDTAKLSFIWTSSLNASPNSRESKSTSTPSLSVNIALNDENGKACAEPFTQKLASGHPILSLPIVVNSSCEYPKATVTITDSSNNLLARSVFETTPPVKTTPKITPSNSYTTAGALVLLVGIGSLLYVYYRKRFVVPSVAPAVLAFTLAGSIFMGTGNAHADTWLQTTCDGSSTPHCMSDAYYELAWVTANINKASFSYGETMTISGSDTIINAMSGGDLLTAGLDGDNISLGIFGTAAGQAGSGSASLTFTPATAAGSHVVNLWFRTSGLNGANTQHTIPFTIMAGAPTINIYISLLEKIKSSLAGTFEL